MYHADRHILGGTSNEASARSGDPALASSDARARGFILLQQRFPARFKRERFQLFSGVVRMDGRVGRCRAVA